MKRVFIIIIMLISLVVINNLIRSIISLSQKKDLISSAQKQLDKEKKENDGLKQQLQQVNNTRFIEEQARNKLFMVKDGEQLVLLPKDVSMPQNTAVTQKTTEKSPFEQWIALFMSPVGK